MRKPRTRRWLPAALPLLLVVPLAVGGTSARAAAAPTFANWAQSRFDLANSGRNPNESTIDSTNAARLQQAWVRTDDESSNAAAAVVDNIIYMGCGAAMCAVEAPNQVLKWKARIPSGTITYSAAAVAGGLVYAGTNTSGAVYAFDVKTGAIRWSFQTAGHNVWAGPSVAGGVVYVGGDDQNLYALDAGTGAKLWSFSAGTPIVNPPAVVNGVVYLGAGALNVLSASDGRQLWSGLATAAGVTASPAVSGGRVFVAAYTPGIRSTPNFYAFNAAGCGAAYCSPLWSAVVGLPPPAPGELDGIQSSPAVDQGSVYVGAPDGRLYALDPANGAVRWAGQTHGSQTTAQHPSPTPIASSPSVANGVVYVTSFDGYIYAYAASGCGTTACSWLFAASLDGGQGNGYVSNCWNTTTSSPVVVNGVVYVGGCTQTYTDALYAFTVLPCPPGNPPAGGQYHAVSPTRLLDTRTSSALGNQEARRLQVAGSGGIPSSGVSAAILNVTATATTAASYLTVYPSGALRPIASNLNWVQGRTVANLVEVALGPDGAVNLFNAAGSTDIVVDAQGWVQATTSTAAYGSYLNPMAPFRVLDTRDGTGGPNIKLGPGATISVPVDGGFSDALAVNMTVTNASAPSYLVVWPAGQPRPNSSNLNFAAGETVANRIMMPVAGSINIYNAAGSVDVIADLNGAFRPERSNGTTACRLMPVTPTRILDTRNGGRPLGPSTSMAVQVTGTVVPASARAVVLNITVTDTSAASYLTAWPDQSPRPLASDLNWTAGQTVPSLAVVELSTDGKLDLYNAAGTTDVVVDVAGWYQ
ncbi:MAG TPA: PQQ-binding-like beta-propeller repeat protein [Candidatus Dormibacteraeota bacterium]|nr:PQQ-binding-like beta-propeller repeat protein [Candidatus Dormibacteraeota bacterium]